MLEYALDSGLSLYVQRFTPESEEEQPWLEEVHTRGIREVILWGSPTEAGAWKRNPGFIKLIKSLKSEQISITTLDGSKFNLSDKSVEKLISFLQARGKKSPVLFWYSLDEADRVLSVFKDRFPLTEKIVSTPFSPIKKPAPVQEVRSEFANYGKSGKDSAEREAFRPSQVTIRVKLLSIVSAIVVLSMGFMIALATTLFRNYTVSLIQEYNLSLARLTGLQVGLRVRDLADKADEFYEKSPGQVVPGTNSKKGFLPKDLEAYFASQPRILAWGKAKDGEANLFFNPRFLKELRTEEEPIRAKWNSIPMTERTKLLSSDSDKLHVSNISSKFGFPLVLFSERKKGGSEASFFLLAPTDLWESARSALQTELFEIWIVDSQGKLVAHTNEAEALSEKDYSKNPLVQFLLRNPTDNGSRTTDYEGKETLGSFQQLEDGNLAVISSIEAEKAFEAVYKIRRQNLYILLCVLSIAFLVVFLFSRTLTVPIINLLSATRQIERGNYHVAIRPVTRDEVGVLTNSFLKMAQGLEEREKIKDTFGKFVNKEIAERALSGEVSLGGETKEVAVFFSDLRNFTGMSERLKPSEVVEFLNAYFTEMVECIYLTQGIVDKFIGDAIMAHWGALYSDGNDTRNAVNAGLLMRNALIEFNRIGSQIGRPKARFGCGINTGSVVVGQIGSEKKFEFTVIGDAVNLASRIEYLTKDFGTDILISSSSFEKVKDYYLFEALPPVWIRGKEEPQYLYAVLGWKEDPECPKSLEEVRRICEIPEPAGPSQALAH
ncbi:adenylate/guanylate cyclase catalytic domain protein [Leptospira broomii serovar Hurstbridge str. 5399]|uniref:Adenylate/guanylate cyclase catalytic domain protein n=1 Tax=Leptospira broomii serovar Hurstbridge str. 5399 TaxID=1049789 RepID=T0F0Z8_9LEPT|nr:adenylate/guanylate cyclase domain-containing protein [Leptospira broomii]EQA44830.1 adenylate/guanylate cyclase catalytic domain protein [Leptospira broomii serovar Hurstbridge str. 5399]